jgi:hypothetical protein
MPRLNLQLNDTEDIRNLIQQLNNKLREVELALQRIEGLDGSTPTIFNDIDMNNKTLKNVNPFTAIKILEGEEQTLPTPES